MSSSRSALLLAGVLTTTGVLHFARPRPFDALIPPALPGPARAWTYGSGAVELAVAAALTRPRSRRPAGLAAALLFVGVLPGNVQMAVDAHRRPASRAVRAATLARLPLQLPLVGWGLRIFRERPR